MSHAKMVLGALSLVGASVLAGIAWAQNDAEYTVVIKKYEVMTTNKDGKSWDINDGKPDLCVVLRNTSVAKSDPFTSKERTDTFQSETTEPTTIKFRAGNSLEIQVIDKDVAANDEIGKTTLTPTAEQLKNGEHKLENFGRVKHLVLEFKKL